MKVVLIIFLALIIQVNLLSQLIPISYNLNNRELINIASPNLDRIKNSFETQSELMIYHRSQWTGINQGLRWYGMRSTYDLSNNANLGISAYYESFGPLRSYFISGIYAYRIKLSNNELFNLGVSTRYNSNNLNFSNTSYKIGDPLISATKSNSYLSIIPGINYQGFLDNYDIGYNFGICIQNAFNVKLSGERQLSPIRVLVLNASMIKFLSPGYDKVSSYESGIVYRRNSHYSDDLHLYYKYTFNGIFSARPGIRLGLVSGFEAKVLHMDIGFPLGNLLKLNNVASELNYVFELPISSRSSALGLTHEISLTALF